MALSLSYLHNLASAWRSLDSSLRHPRPSQKRLRKAPPTSHCNTTAGPLVSQEPITAVSSSSTSIPRSTNLPEHTSAPPAVSSPLSPFEDFSSFSPSTFPQITTITNPGVLPDHTVHIVRNPRENSNGIPRTTPPPSSTAFSHFSPFSFSPSALPHLTTDHHPSSTLLTIIKALHTTSSYLRHQHYHLARHLARLLHTCRPPPDILLHPMPSRYPTFDPVAALSTLHAKLLGQILALAAALTALAHLLTQAHFTPGRQVCSRPTLRQIAEQIAEAEGLGQWLRRFEEVLKLFLRREGCGRGGADGEEKRARVLETVKEDFVPGIKEVVWGMREVEEGVQRLVVDDAESRRESSQLE